MQQRSRISTIGGVLAGILLAGGAAAVEPFVKKTLDGVCLPMDHPEFYETRIYIRKTTMQDCVASGGVEVQTRGGDEESAETQTVAVK